MFMGTFNCVLWRWCCTSI